MNSGSESYTCFVWFEGLQVIITLGTQPYTSYIWFFAPHNLFLLPISFAIIYKYVSNPNDDIPFFFW